jgi:RecA-family ATPase
MSNDQSFHSTFYNKNHLPRGVWLQGDSSIFFDASYGSSPIVRCSGRYPNHDRTSGEVCDPTSSPDSDGEIEFYDDTFYGGPIDLSAMGICGKEREDFHRELLKSTPALEKEIRRRDEADRITDEAARKASAQRAADRAERERKRREALTPQQRAWEDGASERAFRRAAPKPIGPFVPPTLPPKLPPNTPGPAPSKPVAGEPDDPPAVSTELRSRRINVASLEGKKVPDREWLVHDLVPAKNVTLLYGDGGTGKSLVELQMSADIVTGTPFFTHLVQKGSVEFITAEDSLDEMHRRLADISQANGIPLSALSGLHITSLAEVDAMLAVADDARSGALAMTALYRELESVIAESKPALVVLDTLADVFGGNEVIRAQARQFIASLRRLCFQYGTTIIVLAHPSVAGMEKGTSGSTGWNNSVRSRLLFKRVYENDGRTELDEDARVLQVGKSNYGRVGLEIRMQWRRGVFVHKAGGDPLVLASKGDRVFLELLTKARSQNVEVHLKTGKGYAPEEFKVDASKQGVSKDELAKAMKRLLDVGQIENAPFGPPSRIRYRLQLAGGA